MNKYKVGDVVTYYAFGNVRRVVLVTNKEDNVFDGVMVDEVTYQPVPSDLTYWGYNDQIVAVRKLQHA
jgi:hypothetical protein